MCCDSWGGKELDTTERLNCIELKGRTEGERGEKRKTDGF